VAAVGAWQKSPPHAVADTQSEQEPSGTLLGLNRPPSNPLAPEPAPLAQAPAGGRARGRVTPASRRRAGEGACLGQRSSSSQYPPAGEIYIDGEHQGTAPSTTTFDLEPGMHRIEVRSGSRKPFLTYMTVEVGDVRRIRHDFGRQAEPPAHLIS